MYNNDNIFKKNTPKHLSFHLTKWSGDDRPLEWFEEAWEESNICLQNLSNKVVYQSTSLIL